MSVSVCMATFNGARFIREQIDSILPQLGEVDELIISDDGSSDSTLSLISAYEDPRIRVLDSGSRLGYARNFERALLQAKGELIFLSDQDDVWHPDKLVRMKQVFEENPRIALVHHERTLIDESGGGLGPGPSLGAFVGKGVGFVLREGVKSRLWGCAIGMRRSALEMMLPFPSSVYGHDHWAVIVGGMSGGVFLLPEKLISHRLHGNNVTPKQGLPWMRRIQVRLDYLAMMLEAFRRTRRS